MPKIISNIVFTRNRPLQLEGYLESLYRHFPKGLLQTYIIYKVDLFDSEYSQLFQKYPDCIVIEETGFHDDFVALIDRLETKYILFGTDDVVYFDSVDFGIIDQTFGAFPDDIFGFSLRLSLDYVKSGSDVVEEFTVAGQAVYRINWKKGKLPNTKYPFELDSTVYQTDLVRKVVKKVAKDYPILKKLFNPTSLHVKLLKRIISMKNFLVSIDTFFNPNTLESYCYRWCRNHKGKVPSYIYFQKICSTAIQINTVNTFSNEKNFIRPVKGKSVIELNEKYRSGLRLDIEAIEKNKPRATHVWSEYFKLKRL